MTRLLVPNRRGFLLGLGSLVAAPAIVHASIIMPVKVPKIILATEADLAALSHADTEIKNELAIRDEQFARAAMHSAVTGLDGERFYIEAQINFPRAANRIDDPGLTDRILKRLVKERMLTRENGKRKLWGSESLAEFTAPREWFDSDFKLIE